MIRRLVLCQLVALSISRTMTSGAVKKLNDLGYGFQDGLLFQYDKEKSVIKAKRFDFNLYPDHSENQKHYEALGEIITEYVYDRMLDNGMHRINIPLDAPTDTETSFIFSTQKELKRPKKLLVLIHGSGVVRAGQWARSLIINHSEESGTQIPYVNEGRARDFEVLSLNTNENYGPSGAKLPHSESPVAHAKYVWEKIILPADPESVAIVAHSYGGHVTMWLARQYPDFFRSKVFAVAFTDSVENSAHDSIRDHMNKVTVNWAASEKPLDSVLRPQSKSNVEYRSAAHVKHEFTTYSSQRAVFEFIDKRYQEFSHEFQSSLAKKPKLQGKETEL